MFPTEGVMSKKMFGVRLYRGANESGRNALQWIANQILRKLNGATAETADIE